MGRSVFSSEFHPHCVVHHHPSFYSNIQVVPCVLTLQNQSTAVIILVCVFSIKCSSHFTISEIQVISPCTECNYTLNVLTILKCSIHFPPCTNGSVNPCLWVISCTDHSQGFMLKLFMFYDLKLIGIVCIEMYNIRCLSIARVYYLSIQNKNIS